MFQPLLAIFRQKYTIIIIVLLVYISAWRWPTRAETCSGKYTIIIIVYFRLKMASKGRNM
jgi:hypothetical protein